MIAGRSSEKEDTMSLFDAINRALGANETHAGLVSGAMEALGGGQGLNGLAEAVPAKGLGDVVSQPLAARVGLSTEAATTLLAQVLPQAVDRLTPDGTVPTGGLLDQAAGILRGPR
jgi:uncharacterized protein YidB (DUF937 family)